MNEDLFWLFWLLLGLLGWIAGQSDQGESWRGPLSPRPSPRRYIHDKLKQDGATAIDIASPYLSDGRRYRVYKVAYLAASGAWRQCEVYVPWGGQIIWDYDGDPFHRLDFELKGDADFVAQQAELAQVMKQLRARGLLLSA